MHWICDSLRNAGWHVRFITCDFSLITKLKGDRRTEFGQAEGINLLKKLNDSLSVGVVSSIWHPVGRDDSFWGRLADRVTSHYPPLGAHVVRTFAEGSDLVIIESCGGLFMLDKIRESTAAPIIYRVSDNLSVVRPVPALLKAERRAISNVDVVSMASEHLAKSLKVEENLRLDPMGLDKTQFDLALESPYRQDNRKKVVISGSSGLDVESLGIAAEAFPDWDFIQFGSAVGLPRMTNIIDMGERPFKELVPWVKFADIGFAPYLTKPGFEYQAEHSNRLLQYVYSRLPCVVPRELASASKPHFIGYKSGDKASIASAMRSAQQYDRTAVPAETVLDWDQLAQRLANVCKNNSRIGLV
jgi:2-beta-glucuronyltransferase